MSALDKLDWNEVRSQYDNRIRIHRQLLSFLKTKTLANLLICCLVLATQQVTIVQTNINLARKSSRITRMRKTKWQH